MITFFRNIDIEGPMLLGDILDQYGLSYQVIAVDEAAPETWPNPDSVSALVVLGGPMNVYEEERHPFLKAEVDWIKTYLTLDKPYLGICLGSQLLARASGGQVKKGLSPEIGFHQVTLTALGSDSILFQSLPKDLMVFQWHEDVCLPTADSQILAQSPLCPVQAFQVRRCAYGIQFHGELSLADVKLWGKTYMKDLHQRKEFLNQLDAVAIQALSITQSTMATLFQNFLTLLPQTVNEEQAL